jgi:hypothetical protein
VDNLVRLVPVLNVTQNQRLLLVVSLAHVLLGASGIEAWREWVDPASRRLRLGLIVLLVAAAGALAAAAVSVRFFEPQLRARAAAHYASQATARGLAADSFQDRADRLPRQAIEFFPRCYLASSGYAVLLAGLACLARARPGRWLPAMLFALTVFDLFLFGRGYNPAIPLDQYFPDSPVTSFLRCEAQRGDSTPFRVLALEEEFPPNVLGRYELADLRNYDAVEVRGLLDFFAPLWLDGTSQLTSNSWTRWDRIASELWRLRLANVRYLISTSDPPPELTDVRVVFQHGRVRVCEFSGSAPLVLMPQDRVRSAGATTLTTATLEYRPGRIECDVFVTEPGGVLVLSETYMPGWQAWIDGLPGIVESYEEAFVAVEVSPGTHRVVVAYRPRSFQTGAVISAVGFLAIAGLFGNARRRLTGVHGRRISASDH